MTKLIYLGRLVDVTGMLEEEADLPDNVGDTDQLRSWIAERFANAETGFDKSVRIALDSAICAEPASLAEVKEIAFLPPVGGG